MIEEIKGREYNKSEWSRGPWDQEPDRMEWEHAGFVCLAVRNPMGAWCGYVGVPPSHKLYGKDYEGIDHLVEVHGGPTYSNKCRPPICHNPKPGEVEDLWWIGFDCAHGGDIIPAISHLAGRYRDMDYIREETNRLTDQLGLLE